MRRREFLTLLGGAAAARPTVARGQQEKRTARVAVFSYSRENDPKAKFYVEAFLKGLAELGWSQGSNLRVEYRWTGGNAALTRRNEPELSTLAPAVLPVAGGAQAGPLWHMTRTHRMC